MAVTLGDVIVEVPITLPKYPSEAMRFVPVVSVVDADELVK